MREVKMFTFHVMGITFDSGDEELKKCAGKGDGRCRC